MKIQLSSKYKSLYKFESDELSNFTIITGKNGSGKTQLIDLISSSTNYQALGFTSDIQNIQVEGIKTNDSEPININFWKLLVKAEIMPTVGELSRNTHLLPYRILSSADCFNLFINSSEGEELLNLPEHLENTIRENFDMQYGDIYSDSTLSNKDNDFKKYRIQYLTSTKKDFFFKRHIYTSIIAAHLTNKKHITELTEIDFLNIPINEISVSSKDIFNTKPSVIFYGYAKKRNLNEYHYFQKVIRGRDTEAIPDDEFVKKYPEPWIKLNEIFDEHRIPFYVKEISNNSFHDSMDYTFNLYKNNDNEPILFNELSSGEQIIIGIILKLFTYQSYSDDLQLPQLIIFDEPDANLHPEICKLLIDVLNDTFVNKYGIKVIITTHSATTVALAPEDSIYELKNGIETSLKKVTKDYALNLLTGFIPTLNIDYRNHRQVFVEAPNDRYYYQSIFDIHSQNKKLDYKLYFVSNDAGKGNCETVKTIVNTLRSSGLSTTWGIIDKDKDNKSENFVLVHGEDERYSIENFLFDPIYVVCLMIKDNIMRSRDELGLDEFYIETNLKYEKEEIVQKFSNFFFEKICGHKKFMLLNKNKEIAEVEYYSGHKLSIPKWYLEIQGHDDLVPALKVQLEPLFSKYRNNNQIEGELIRMICKNYPFVPKSSIALIERLATHSS